MENANQILNGRVAEVDLLTKVACFFRASLLTLLLQRLFFGADGYTPPDFLHLKAIKFCSQSSFLLFRSKNILYFFTLNAKHRSYKICFYFFVFQSIFLVSSHICARKRMFNRFNRYNLFLQFS